MRASLYVTARLIALLGLVAGCDGSPLAVNGPLLAVEPDLHFVRVAEDAPPLLDTVVTFWAVRGQERSVEIRYLQNGGYEGGLCLQFTVPAAGLWREPGGSVVGMGDSVEITVRVLDTERFYFEFEPAGLKFDPAHPAKLRVNYRWADRDFDGDGMVDAAELGYWEGFGFWRQEQPGEPWAQSETRRTESMYDAVTLVSGFTRYALASN
jgi:hypothetical protein